MLKCIFGKYSVMILTRVAKDWVNWCSRVNRPSGSVSKPEYYK